MYKNIIYYKYYNKKDKAKYIVLALVWKYLKNKHIIMYYKYNKIKLDIKYYIFYKYYNLNYIIFIKEITSITMQYMIK